MMSGLSFPEFDLTSENMKLKMNDFYDVLLVCPKSILSRKSQYGGSI